MTPSHHVPRLLHDEHLATIQVLETLESRLLGAYRHAPPDPAEPEVARTLRAVADALDGEVGRHFEFEEEHVFPRVAAEGDSDIVAYLTEEHAAIRPLAEDVVRSARAAAADGFDAAAWARFRPLGLELVERLVSHIQKEEMGLLPVLDDILDEAADRELVGHHVGS